MMCLLSRPSYIYGILDCCGGALINYMCVNIWLVLKVLYSKHILYKQTRVHTLRSQLISAVIVGNICRLICQATPLHARDVLCIFFFLRRQQNKYLHVFNAFPRVMLCNHIQNGNTKHTYMKIVLKIYSTRSSRKPIMHQR